MKNKKNILTIILLPLAVIYLYPMVWLLFYSLKNNEEIFVTNPFGPPLEARWDNYTRAVQQFDIISYFKNSVIVTLTSIVFGILFALMFTYVVARVKNKKTQVMKTFILAGMFIPIQSIMTPLVVTIKMLHLTNTLWALIVPYIVLSFPFAVMILYGFIVSLPLDLEESAYLDGASFYQTFFLIVIPLLKPIISVLFIYQFMSNWNELGLAVVLVTKKSLKTLPLGLLSFTGQFSADWGPAGAAMVIASVPVIIIYLFFSDKIENSMILTGLKG